MSVIIPLVVALPKYIIKLVKNKNIFTLVGIATFAIYSLAYLFAKEYGWLQNGIAFYTSTIVLFILGLALCIEVLRGIKNNQQNISLIPFGPALVLAAFIAIAFLPIA